MDRVRSGLLRDLLPHLLPKERDPRVIDSAPVPVVGFAHAHGEYRCYGEADDRHVARSLHAVVAPRRPTTAVRLGRSVPNPPGLRARLPARDPSLKRSASGCNGR
jgi:hypothetical protein